MGDTLEIGSSLGPYQIVSKIGSGGMGEVYLAEDLRLRRKVALKVLPEAIAKDESRLRRFEQEAFAASGLSHPNILTIYEFGTDNGTHFLASEFVAGKTLREHMHGRPLSIDESLDIAIQTSAALSAAHEAGIIHRDIKPENIMIRGDRLIKVLDFGLAKLAEKKSETFDTEAETRAQMNTAPGVIMGTAAYMSPEQARGKTTDARSDIWSLGIVLYEMITGRTPFAGETTSDCIAAIIHKNPPPFALLNMSVPAQLEEIIGKCLEKDADERYQSTKDLLVDLRRVKRRLDFEAEKERTYEPQLTGTRTEGLSEDNTQILNVTTGSAGTRTQTVSSAEYVVTEIKRHKLFALGVVALIALAGLGFGIYKYSAFPSMKAGRFISPQNLKFTRLMSGQINNVRISPDGRYAAYVTSVGGDKSNIRLRQIATTIDVEIVAPAAGSMIGLNFSPSGDYLYYIIAMGVQQSAIYRVSTLGGSPIKIVDKPFSIKNTAVSPDGRTVAFLCEDFSEKVSFLLLANADGSDERTLVKLNDPRSLGNGMAWSTDGRTIAFNIETLGNTERSLKVFGVDVADGSQRQLSDQEWDRIPSIVWLPDGSLIGSGNKKTAESRAPRQLWLIEPNSEVRALTNDLNGFGAVSATAKGDVLLATTQRNVGNLWTAPNNDATRATQIPSSSDVFLVNWTPDNKFVYTSRMNDIWTMNSDGTDQRQLTANQGQNAHASMTSDLRYIVFVSNRVSGLDHIFRMDPDGRNLKQLTSGIGEWWPRLSPDGKWVYYAAFTPENEPSKICKVSIDGGEPVVVARVPGNVPNFDISPHDGMIAYRQTEKGQEKAAGKIFIISPDGGEPIKTLLIPPTAIGTIRWTPDGRSIAFLDTRNNGANIWAVSIDATGEAKPLTDFKTESSQMSFAWSTDGKQLAVIRGTSVTDAVLITETK